MLNISLILILLNFLLYLITFLRFSMLSRIRHIAFFYELLFDSERIVSLLWFYSRYRGNLLNRTLSRNPSLWISLCSVAAYPLLKFILLFVALSLENKRSAPLPITVDYYNPCFPPCGKSSLMISIFFFFYSKELYIYFYDILKTITYNNI